MELSILKMIHTQFKTSITDTMKIIGSLTCLEQLLRSPRTEGWRHSCLILRRDFHPKQGWLSITPMTAKSR